VAGIKTEQACRTCGIVKPIDEFYTQAHGGAPLTQCKPCYIQQRRDRGQRSPEYQRATDLWKNYRIRPERYDEILEAQGGACAICGSKDPGWKRRYFSVDHDHSCCPDSAKSCGQCVRGLLCGSCNVLIGHARDDVDILTSAAAYLISGGQ